MTATSTFDIDGLDELDPVEQWLAGLGAEFAVRDASADPDNMPTTLGVAAVAYARAGIPVFPTEPGGKKPLLMGGYKVASNDVDQVARWWTQYPHANIATATGLGELDGHMTQPPVRFNVLDFDIKVSFTGEAHKKGAAGLAAWRNTGRLGAPAGVARSRHGGLHVYYAATSDKRAALDALSIDYQASGAAITLPPSRVAPDPGVRGSGVYEWLVPLEPSLAQPADWAPFAAMFTPKPRVRDLSKAPLPVGKLLEYWVADIAEAGEGARNRKLFVKCCQLFERDEHADAEPLIEAAIAVGLPRVEAESVARSAHATVAGQ